jgi:hypothetical protein
MKVLVPVKRVVDYNVKIRVKADGSGVLGRRQGRVRGRAGPEAQGRSRRHLIRMRGSRDPVEPRAITLKGISRP